MAKVRDERQNEVLTAMSKKLGREDIWIGGQDLVVEGKDEKGIKPPQSYVERRLFLFLKKPGEFYWDLWRKDPVNYSRLSRYAREKHGTAI